MSDSTNITLLMSDCEDNDTLFRKYGVGQNIISSTGLEEPAIYYCKISGGITDINDGGKVVLNFNNLLTHFFAPTKLAGNYIQNNSKFHKITINWDCDGVEPEKYIDEYVFEPYVSLQSGTESEQIAEIEVKYGEFISSEISHVYTLSGEKRQHVKITVDFEDMKGNVYKIYTMGLLINPLSINSHSGENMELNICRCAYSGDVASVVLAFESTDGDYTETTGIGGKPIISILP